MPRIVDHDAARDEILAGAFAAFARAGPDGLSMRALAAEVGVSTGTLYHYFPHKEAIVDRLFPWAADRHVAALLQAIPNGASRAEQAAAMATFLDENGEDLRQTLQLAFDVRRGSPKAQEALHRALGIYRAGLTHRLGLAGDGEAGVILSLIMGLLAQDILAPGSTDRASHEQALARLLAGGVQTACPRSPAEEPASDWEAPRT